MSFRFVLFGLCCVVAVSHTVNSQSVNIDSTTLNPVVEKKEEMEKKADMFYLTPGFHHQPSNSQRNRPRIITSVVKPDPLLGFLNINPINRETKAANEAVTNVKSEQIFANLGPETMLSGAKRRDSLTKGISKVQAAVNVTNTLNEQIAKVQTAMNVTNTLNQQIANLNKDINSLMGTVNGTLNSSTSNSSSVNITEVCYPKVGCFDMREPWKSRKVPPPENPTNMHTTLYFYSRANLKEPVKIHIYPEVNMTNATYDPAKKTVFIIHGFQSSGNVTWKKNIKNVYLQEADANVLIVDWGKGANRRYYQVAGNTRVVGKQLALFAKYLISKYGANPANFHLIGHSLGAQICSYFAKQVPGIGRITALDPAQPGFEGYDKAVRLDKSDANFVEVIHTDARPFNPGLGFGMIGPHGHIDFYMNGGFDQPGCFAPLKRNILFRAAAKLAKYPISILGNWVSCSHGRAYTYFTEALNSSSPCVLMGYRANMTNMFRSPGSTQKGLVGKLTPISTNCSVTECVPMGLNTDKAPYRGVFVVNTGRKSPFCKLNNSDISRKIQIAKTAVKYTRLFARVVKSVY